MEEPKQKKNQIQIELNDEVAQGTYSNLAIITHSAAEFIVDFVRVVPGVPKAKVQSRVILTPEHAKRLMHALKDNIDKYETAYGEIKNTEGKGGSSMPMNFGGPTAQA